MTAEGKGTVPAPDDPEFLILDPDRPGLTMTILLGTPPGGATGLAMFDAAAAVNRVQSVPGFLGAAFMVSPRDDMLLEFVRWESAEALAEAQGDNRYSDHVHIGSKQSVLQYLGVSPLLRGAAPLSLTRGDDILAWHVAIPGAAEASATLAGPGCEPAAPGLVRHVAASDGGVGISTISKSGYHPLAARMSGVERWRSDFRVVEALTADPAKVNGPVRYRLLDEVSGQAGAGLGSSDG